MHTYDFSLPVFEKAKRNKSIFSFQIKKIALFYDKLLYIGIFYILQNQLTLTMDIVRRGIL